MSSATHTDTHGHDAGHDDSHGSADPHITPDFHISSHGDDSHSSHAAEPGAKIDISKYTKALIRSWHEGVHQISPSPNKISVSQTVSFAAFLYEKMRNAVEFKEEHLIRKSAIQRIIKRRMILNENGRDIAEPLIKELLWARYYENNTIGEEKMLEVQTVIDKYFFLRNELSKGRRSKEHEQIGKFMLDCMSCEIEERLSPNPKRESFTNFVYQILRPHIMAMNEGEEMERDIQVYIAVEKAFGHSDLPTIKYHLLKLMLPDITKITWRSAEKIMPYLYDVYSHIEKDLDHPLGDKIRNIVRKQMPPFLILWDVFNSTPHNLEEVLVDENKLKYKVDNICRKRYDESRVRLRRIAVKSFIYILLTKVIFAFIIEVPYDLYIQQSISYIPIIVNVIIPPIFMALIILTVTIPGDDNTRRIFQMIKGILTEDPSDTESIKPYALARKPRARGIVFNSLFTLLYMFTYFVTFGGIIYLLSRFNFSPVSQGIFIFFLTLVTFFAFRVIQITQEYQVVEKEFFLSPIIDFFFLPVIRVGRWLSGEILQKFNFLIFVFDFIIEMPFKAIVEVVDEWVHFVKVKKEEIV